MHLNSFIIGKIYFFKIYGLNLITKKKFAIIYLVQAYNKSILKYYLANKRINIEKLAKIFIIDIFSEMLEFIGKNKMIKKLFFLLNIITN